jgi:hypothetical protein
LLSEGLIASCDVALPIGPNGRVEHLGSLLNDICLDFPHLNELFQRRHIVVHSGGIVNRFYLERVDLPEQDAPVLGVELPISSSYLQSALDELAVLGYGLAALAWTKWGSEKSDEASAFLNSRIYDLLQGGRYQLARKLADVGSALDQSDNKRWMIAVNGWIATKKLGEFDSCTEAVANWDVSALANDFKLAKTCLLEQTKQAFELLAVTIHESDDKPAEVWEWPLLDDLRSDPRFTQIFLDAGFTPPNREEPE